MIQKTGMAIKNTGMAGKSRKTTESTRSKDHKKSIDKKSVEKAIRSAKEAIDRPKRGRWIGRSLIIGATGLVGLCFYDSVVKEHRTEPLQSTQQEVQHKAMPAPQSVAVPAAIKPSLTAANKDVSNTMPAFPWELAFEGKKPSPTAAKKDTPTPIPTIINMINENAKCNDSLRSAKHIISQLKAQLAAARKATEKKDTAAVSVKPDTVATPDTAKQDSTSDSASIQKAALLKKNADSVTALEVFTNAPESVQDYLTYLVDSSNDTTLYQIRINLGKIMGGGKRYLDLTFDSQPVEINGIEITNKKTCIIKLADRTFTIEMEKKGSMLSKTYTNIIIKEKDASTDDTKTAWLTVDKKGRVGGSGESLNNISIKAIWAGNDQ